MADDFFNRNEQLINNLKYCLTIWLYIKYGNYKSFLKTSYVL